MKGSLTMISFMGREFMYERMEGDTKEHEKIIK